MSPEQAKGRAADKRADIWAFGVVLFEMLTGRTAFQGETISDVLAKIIEREPDWNVLPAATSPRLRDCSDAACRKIRSSDCRRSAKRGLRCRSLSCKKAPPSRHSRSVLAPLPWAIAATLLLTTLTISLVHFRETRPPATSIRFQVSAPENNASRRVSTVA